MHSIITNNKGLFDKTIVFFEEDIASLRTGRAAPSLVEKVMVEAYGTVSPLLQLAAINTPEPQTIAIKPWDKSILKDIEKALNKADLNINPIVDGDLIRLNFPPLTEESRKDLVKILNKKMEVSRVALRGQSHKVKDEIIALEKARGMSEDEKFQALKDLDNLTKEYNEKIKLISDKKEKEIMTI